MSVSEIDLMSSITICNHSNRGFSNTELSVFGCNAEIAVGY